MISGDVVLFDVMAIELIAGFCVRRGSMTGTLIRSERTNDKGWKPLDNLWDDNRLRVLSGLPMDYATLSLADVRTELDNIARETQATFGGFNARQLNWRPDAARWSVAQCYEHLVAANGLIFQAADASLNEAVPRTLWQRLPVLPGVMGRMLIHSQAPGAARRFTAPSKAQPATSDIAADIIQRFIEQHRNAVARVRALDERDAARAIMISPFIRFVTYSVLDGLRLVLAHDRRHFEQARRVTLSPGFPGS